MEALDPHSLKVLEYDRVLEMLAGRVPSTLGRTAVAALRPAGRREQVLVSQRQTAEMRRLVEEGRGPSWGGSQDVSEEIGRLAAEGSWIEPHSYLRVAEFTEAADRIRRVISVAGDDAPHLGSIVGPMEPFEALSREIRRCLTAEGEVADEASPELARLRRAVESIRRDIIRTLERLLQRSGEGGALQEKIVTLRAERYVVPVKAGARGAVPGLVHDRSASGQTLFIEPQEVVEVNNALRETAAAEKEEVRRILKLLGRRVREAAPALEDAMERLGIMEAILAKAILAMEFDMVEPEILDGNHRMDLRGAKHPLLLAAIGERAVPLDFAIGGETRTLVLTGPNTGGKTVTLKTIGLLALMAQSGMQIPASAGSGLSCFADVLADIGDEQSIDQNLSTFSGHLKNLIAVMKRAREGALVLLDELGAGTDPAEGAALGIAVLEEILAAGALTVATTHHNAVKVFASSAAAVANASMEFDAETLQPTFSLVTGIPGRSQAFHIALRLGIDEKVIARARRHQNAGEVRLDELMADLERQRGELAAQKAVLEREGRAAADEVEREKARWERARARIEEEGRQAILKAERDVTAALREMKAREGGEGGQKGRDAIKAFREVLREHVPPPAPAPPAGLLHRGDRVYVRTLRAWGTVEETGPQTAAVVVGGKRCTVPLHQIEGRAEDKEAGTAGRRIPRGRYTVEVPDIPSTRIDLRGLRADEALAVLDRFLGHALLSGLPEIDVLHGKGTGRLQEAVTDYLARHPRVEQFGPAPLEQGGAGVTRVRLAV